VRQRQSVGGKEKKIIQVSVCQIVTSRPSLGTQSHLSSRLSIVWEHGWVGYHEALDAGGGWCGTPISHVRMPTGHNTVDLRAFEVGYLTGGSGMVRAATEAALSPSRTVDGVVVGKDLPTLVAEMRIQGGRSAIRVGTVSWLEGGFFGEDSPEHMRGDSGINELVGSGEEGIVITMEAVFEDFGYWRSVPLVRPSERGTARCLRSALGLSCRGDVGRPCP